MRRDGFVPAYKRRRIRRMNYLRMMELSMRPLPESEASRLERWRVSRAMVRPPRGGIGAGSDFHEQPRRRPIRRGIARRAAHAADSYIQFVYG